MAKNTNETVKDDAIVDSAANTQTPTVDAAPLDLSNFMPESNQDEKPVAEIKSAGDIGDDLGVKDVEHYNKLMRDFNFLFNRLHTMIAPGLPTVASIYDEKTRFALAQDFSLVFEEEGWLKGGITGKYGKKINLVLSVGGLAFVTNQAFKHDLAMHKKMAAEMAANGEAGNAAP